MKDLGAEKKETSFLPMKDEFCMTKLPKRHYRHIDFGAIHSSHQPPSSDPALGLFRVLPSEGTFSLTHSHYLSTLTTKNRIVRRKLNLRALLEEAEKRDQELKQKLQKRLLYIDEDEGVADSRSRTWKPSVVAGNPPAKENNKHPFSLVILSEELPKRFKYPMDMAVRWKQ
ncbi:hypothetical protein PIB30_047936 [Stylosanthes scabra]|uniref:Uncharacterized protein n=1 Tax=Stylosanthes scabra TaxID=79078 RepID=A0ABU6VGZ3_9FABA|nr:hypothetical protein [Stylosanthes scabra]